MKLKRFGMLYMDKNEIEMMNKTDEGKAKLAKIGDFQTVRWITMNPIGKSNRASRRRKINPTAGFMKNNAQHRTKYMAF